MARTVRRRTSKKTVATARRVRKDRANSPSKTIKTKSSNSPKNSITRLIQWRKQAARTRRDRLEQLRVFMGNACVDCGSNQDLRFDHIDRATKIKNVTMLLTNRIEVVFAEAMKCALRCHAHHVDRGRNRVMYDPQLGFDLDPWKLRVRATQIEPFPLRDRVGRPETREIDEKSGKRPFCANGELFGATSCPS